MSGLPYYVAEVNDPDGAFTNYDELRRFVANVNARLDVYTDSPLYLTHDTIHTVVRDMKLKHVKFEGVSNADPEDLARVTTHVRLSHEGRVQDMFVRAYITHRIM